MDFHTEPTPERVAPFLNERDVRRLLIVALKAQQFIDGLERSGGIIGHDSPVGQIKLALAEFGDSWFGDDSW